jgi:hypothetical protein
VTLVDTTAPHASRATYSRTATDWTDTALLTDAELSQRGVRLRHASEQYFTVSQTRSHFRRQTKSRPHTGQSLRGKSRFATAFPLALLVEDVLRIAARLPGDPTQALR